MKGTEDFDFIIAGTGCAGMSMAMALKRSALPFKKVLLVDRAKKTSNDRTWCYWSKDQAQWYDQLVYRTWDRFAVQGPSGSRKFGLSPYVYNMLRGIDFYEWCYRELEKDERFRFLSADINEMYSLNEQAFLRADSRQYTCRYLFNSVFLNQRKSQAGVNFVQQFKGWVIECNGPHGLAEPVLMDFRIAQMGHCRFMYVLPLSPKRMLVECTAFADGLLSLDGFEPEIRHYISDRLHVSEYSIVETEYGEIPMSESEFFNPYGQQVLPIGTAGGAAKPSSGYTFLFIQRQVERIARDLLLGRKPQPWQRAPNYRFYDSVLLRVLRQRGPEGYKIFEALFNKCRIGDVLSFLNEESTLSQDLRVISAMPKLPFMKEVLGKVLEA